MSSIQQQYNQAVKVLKDFGFDNAPSLDQITGKLTDKQLKYIKKNKAVLVITPPLFLKELIDLFGKQQATKALIYNELYDQYDFGNDWRVDFVLPDLKYTNQAIEHQRKSLRKDQKSIKGLQSMNPRTYLMLNVIHRDNDDDLLDQTTWSRFIQYDMKSADGYSWLPFANSSDGQLRFGRSDVLAHPYGGVRFLVGLETKTLNFSSYISFSYSETGDNPAFIKDMAMIQENTAAIKELTEVIKKVFKV